MSDQMPEDVIYDTPEYQDVAHHTPDEEFIKAVSSMQRRVRLNNKERGFEVMDIPRSLCLIHSEISEALEAHREDNPPDKKIPEFDNFTVELADAVIRILDLAGGMKLPLAEAIVAKKAFNKTRPYKHGKAY